MNPPIAAVLSVGTLQLDDYKHLRLVGMDIALHGPVWDLTNPAVRNHIARAHPDLLSAHGVPQLDNTDVLTRNRAFTQQLAATARAEGQAAIQYQSNVLSGTCLAPFDGRYEITRRTAELPLIDALSALTEVCQQLGLDLQLPAQ